MKNFFIKFGFLLCMGAAGLLLMAYLAPFVPPDKFWPVSFLGLAYPYILLANIVFLIYYAIVRSKKFLLPLAIILLGYNHFNNFIQFFPKKEETASGIKVLTYNIHNFEYDRKKKKDQPLAIIEFLKSSKADIICLQEANLYPKGRLSPQSIKAALPKIDFVHLAHASSFSGPLTLSRYPIIAMGEIRFEKSSNMVIFSDIKINENETIRVYNCHFQSYSIKPEKYSIIEPQKSGLGRKQVREARELGYKLKTAFAVRAQQARKVAEHISQCSFPVIVCGDFNDTPVSYTYRTVKKGLTDSFVESGFGISNTYNGILPTLRIDYIFHNEKFKSVNYRRDRVRYSDHFPISCTLQR